MLMSDDYLRASTTIAVSVGDLELDSIDSVDAVNEQNQDEDKRDLIHRVSLQSDISLGLFTLRVIAPSAHTVISL
jgi:hypothetical protein